MAQVHVLDEKTINKIAAGEVVERPLSVVKELVENSIDAGAKTIEVEIATGGIDYIRITDDGIGMTEEDARLAILRHATSKISSVEDLFSIASLGFRGEALASIAAVSHFSLLTRTHTADMGTRITIDGGQFVDCLPYGASPGTTIEVKELFYNVPARRKFLKTPRTEGSKIQDIIGKLALSNSHISFKLIQDGRVSLITPGNGQMVDTVSALYGYKVSDEVFPLTYEAEGIAITGVVGKPTLLKSTRIWQTIIVNNRVVSDRVITKAIDNAYHALLPKTGYPLVFLQLVVPAETVDINVHPRKQEVKFADDKPIYRAVYHAILETIQNPLRAMETGSGLGNGENAESWSMSLPANKADMSPVIESNSINQESKSLSVAEQIATAVNVDKIYGHQIIGLSDKAKEETQAFVERLKNEGYERPVTNQMVQESFEGQSGFIAAKPLPKSYTEEDKKRFFADAYHKTMNRQEAPTGGLPIKDKQVVNHEEDKNPFIGKQEEAHLKGSGLLPMGQVASCFILAKKGDDLYIIDQHAAHERVRYDALCKSAEAIPMQNLLLPIYLEADDQEMALVEDNQDYFQDIGFAISLGGPTQIKIEGIPVDIVESKAEDMVRYVLTYLADNKEPTKAQLRHSMLAYASCRGAIKAGHNLNMYQMSVLIEDLFHTGKPYVCPHGRPTIIKFTPDELGKLFLRS